MKHITIIGSGTMGNGIAHVFAQFGYEVSLCDVSAGALETGLKNIQQNIERQIKKEIIKPEQKSEILSKIKTFTLLNDGVKNADLVIEAATENQDIKLNLFRELDSIAPPS